MKKNTHQYQAGFTLLEYIVSLVIVAIAAAMISTYFGTSFTQSSAPVQGLVNATNLQMVMENMTADYNRMNKINLRYKWKSQAPYSIGDIVLPSDTAINSTSKINNNGRYYICTQAGTSGTTLPGWTITTPPGTAFSDGTVKWKEQGYVWKANTTYPANAIVMPILNNGHFYKGPGYEFTTPNNNEPTWSKVSGATISQPGETWSWTEAGTILKSNNTTDLFLKDNLKYYLDDAARAARYGKDYAVTEARFIQFNGTTAVNAGGNGTSDEQDKLSVTIQDNNSGRMLTTIFTIL